MKHVKALFKKRDSAIKKKDKKAFLSTQDKNKEIAHCRSEAYLRLLALKSKILQLNKRKDNYLDFVEEEYHYESGKPRKGYLLYYIKENKKKPIIKKIVW